MIVKTYKVLSASWNRRGGREKEGEREREGKRKMWQHDTTVLHTSCLPCRRLPTEKKKVEPKKKVIAGSYL